MSLNRFIPSVWAARLMAQLEKSLVYGQPQVVNRDYEGEIREYGDRVYVHGIGEIAVADYTRDVTNINYQLLDDSRKELVIERSKYFAFKVDDADQAQQKPKVIDAASQKATRTLGDVADQYLASFYVDAGHVMDDGAGASIQLTADNIYQTVVDASVILDEANVPSQGRYMIVPPWVAGLMLVDDRFLLSASPESILNGQIAQAAGFAILKSNNVPTTGTAPTVSHITCGHPFALSYAEQIAKVEGIRLQDSFADGIRGLHLYGAEVLEPDALLHLMARK